MGRINWDRCERLDPLERLLPRKLRCLRGSCSCLALLCSRRRGRLVYVACLPSRLRYFWGRIFWLALLCSRRRGHLLFVACFPELCNFFLLALNCLHAQNSRTCSPR